MGTAVRRALAAGAAVSLMTLGTACGSDDAGAGGRSDSGNRESAGSAATGSGDASGATLTERQLGRAALSKRDLGGGYQVSRSPAEDDLNAGVATADDEKCQPVADVLSSKPEVPRAAMVSRSVVRADLEDPRRGVLALTYLASYRAQDASKAFTALKSALGECGSFTMSQEGDSRPYTVKEAKAPGFGDESLAFTLSEGGDEPVMVINVLRSGRTLATFAGISMTGAKPSVPRAVMAKQAGKLAAAAAGG